MQGDRQCLTRSRAAHLIAGSALRRSLRTWNSRHDTSTLKRPKRRKPPNVSLADRLAAYAERACVTTDLDAATVERVKSHVIDTIGCGIAAFDERPVRVCREVALAPAAGAAPSSAPTGAPRPIWRPSPTACASRYLRSRTTPIVGALHRPSERQHRGLPRGRGGREARARPS